MEQTDLAIPDQRSGPLDEGRSSLLAPVIALGATWAVKQLLDRSYQKRMGLAPPTAGNRDASLGKIILWAGLTAAAVTTVEVVVNRVLNKS